MLQPGGVRTAGVVVPARFDVRFRYLAPDGAWFDDDDDAAAAEVTARHWRRAPVLLPPAANLDTDQMTRLRTTLARQPKSDYTRPGCGGQAPFSHARRYFTARPAAPSPLVVRGNGELNGEVISA